MDSYNMNVYDDGNDKKYFTMIPNFILNHSTSLDQALYLQMKRVSGIDGNCHYTNHYFCEKLGTTEHTLRKSLRYLVDHGWIRYNGKKKIRTQGGEQLVNEFHINDIWKMNVDYYSKIKESKGGQNQPYLSKDDERGGKINPTFLQGNFAKGGQNSTSIKELYNNKELNKNLSLSYSLSLKNNYNDEDKRLTDLMYILVKRNYSFIKDKNELGKISDYEEMNRIHRLDNYDYKVIESVIKWCQEDSFWKQNIRSVSTLRKQFESLLIRIKSERDKRKVVNFDE